MRRFIVNSWDAVMDNRYNPLHSLDLATQHYFMQVLGWMWSMVFSLSFLSIYHFGFVWMAHLLLFGGVAMTVAVFHEAQREERQAAATRETFGNASACVWKLDSEA